MTLPESHTTNSHKILSFIYALLASLTGWVIGGLIISILNTSISHDGCDYAQLGRLATYDCPWWHLSNYYIWLQLLAIAVFPFLLNILCMKVFKVKPLNILPIIIAIITTIIGMFLITNYYISLITI